MNDPSNASSASAEGPVFCSLNSVKMGGHVIDIAIQFVGNTPFIIVTQFQKIGSLFHVSPDAPVPGESTTSYHTRVLMGESKPSMVALCETLTRQMSLSSSSMIFALALREETLKDVSAVKEIVRFIVMAASRHSIHTAGHT